MTIPLILLMTNLLALKGENLNAIANGSRKKKANGFAFITLIII